MKYVLNGTWVNDETITDSPLGASVLTEIEWINRQGVPYQPSLAEVKAAFILQVDADADALIDKVIGRRGSEYERAEKEATAYAAAGYPATVPGSASSWATAKGWTATQAADSIIAAATGWRTAQAAMRENRLSRKEAAKIAVNVPALDAIKAQWAGFMAALKAQLGV